MSRIAFYISSHGFGHATREIEIINHLSARIVVEIVTSVPKWLFDHSIHRDFVYTFLEHDCGLIQIDSVKADIGKTLRSWQRLLKEYPVTAKQEGERLLQSNTDLVAGDISPLAVAAAKAAGLRSVIIANFSWDWIFQPLVKYDAAFEAVIAEISDYYRRCDLLLRSPLCGDLSVFPNIQDIPLIARRAKHSRKTMRLSLGIAEDRTVYLLSFGGNSYPLPKHAFEDHGEILFISFDEALRGIPNVLVMDAKTVYHPDIVNLCDGVITKLGYGIVTECIAHGIPIAYPPRADFPEFDVMEQETRRYIPMTRFEEGALKSGNWHFLEHFKSNLRHSEFHRIQIEEIDGGNQAALILQSLVGE